MMMTVDAQFHELKGIGPAAEAKLHESGIRTWAALAETLDALARVKGVDASMLRGLRNEARNRVADSAADVGTAGEQTSRFVVSVVAHPDGKVARSSVIDVRTELTASFAGMSGEDIVSFIERRIGRRDTADMAAERSASTVDLGLVDSVEFDPAQPIRFGASSAANDLVVIEAGKAIGGADTNVWLRWDTSGIDAGDDEEFRYRAELAGRPYGGSATASWQQLGVVAGGAYPGEIVELAFGATGLAPGINRLELTVEVQPLLETNGAARRVEPQMELVQ